MTHVVLGVGDTLQIETPGCVLTVRGTPDGFDIRNDAGRRIYSWLSPKPASWRSQYPYGSTVDVLVRDRWYVGTVVSGLAEKDLVVEFPRGTGPLKTVSFTPETAVIDNPEHIQLVPRG